MSLVVSTPRRDRRVGGEQEEGREKKEDAVQDQRDGEQLHDHAPNCAVGITHETGCHGLGSPETYFAGQELLLWRERAHSGIQTPRNRGS